MTNTSNAELDNFVPRPAMSALWLVLLAILGGLYASSVPYLIEIWKRDDYQHGFFVPIFCLVLLWLRREMILPLPDRGSLWGLAFFPLWIVLLFGSAYFKVLVWAPLSFLFFLAGLAIFVGGWRALRWAWPSIVFLVFMLPLPGFLDSAFRFYLQRLAAVISVYIVQTMGIPSVAQGTMINLTKGPLDVAHACSGLRMIMLFSAVCVGAAFVLRLPLWQKVVIVLSALPIAVISNVARITTTATIHEFFNLTPAQMDTVHTWAGLLIQMPSAMLLIWLEVILLNKLFMVPEQEPAVFLGPRRGGPPRSVAVKAVSDPRRQR